MIRQVITYIGDKQEYNFQLSERPGHETDDSYDSYSVVCANHSGKNVYFYLFQRIKNQEARTASVVWQCSDSKIGRNTAITFYWEKQFYFIWQGYGLMQPGVEFTAKSWLEAKKNSAIFSIEDDTPLLALQDSSTDPAFSIINGRQIPNNTYAVGIGMDKVATVLEQARYGETDTFSPECSYWLAVGDSIKTGMVLSESNIDPMIEIIFHPNEREVVIHYDGNEFLYEGPNGED